MNLQKTSVSEHHSLHNHISLDVLNENREEMPDVEKDKDASLQVIMKKILTNRTTEMAICYL